MSVRQYQEEIAAASSLEEIRNLRTRKPWEGCPFATVLDFALNEKENRLEAEMGRLEAETGRLEAEARGSGTFYARIDDLFERDDLPNKADSSFYVSCCRISQEEAEKAQLERAQKRERRQKEKQRNERKRKRQMGGEEAKNEDDEEGSSEDSTGPVGYICRSGATSNIDPYLATYTAAQNTSHLPAVNEGQSRNSTHSSHRTRIWKTAAVGASPAGDIAHLVPAAVQPANSYWFVTDFLFGRKRRKWDEICRLIHGSNPHNKKSKIASTGIKHMVTNKVLLAGQKDYFDIAPCVLILPIMTRQEALGWRGHGYQAIMLIDDFEGDNRNNLEAVCNLTYFTHKSVGDKAEPNELLTACALLQDYTRAILFAQTKCKPKECDFCLGDVATAFYPKLSANYNGLNVRKVAFQDNNSEDGHPAPDPLLLVSKAIAVLQKRHGFNIVATAEPREDERHGPSDQSILAEEEFLRRREEARVYPDPVGLDIVVSF